MASELTGSRVKAPEIRRGDTVLILTGKDAGKRGVVSRVLRNPQGAERRRSGWRPTSVRPVSVVVEGLNIAKRHTKPRPRMNQSDRVPTMQQGGIIDIPQPIAISNLMIVCQSCDQPTRIGHLRLENGNRVRVCTRPGCGKQLEVKS